MELHEAINKAVEQLETTDAEMVIIGPVPMPTEEKPVLIEEIPFGQLAKESQNHLFQEWISGKTILYRAPNSIAWNVCDKPIWSEDCFYKVKEIRSYTEVKNDVEFYQKHKREVEEHLEGVKLKLKEVVDELRELEEDIPF